MALTLADFGTLWGGGGSAWEIAHLGSMSEGGTGFQPVTCGSDIQDGCATLRTPGRCKRGSLTAKERGRRELSWERQASCPP